MPKGKQTLISSFQSAGRGLGHALNERNFAIQLVIGIMANGLAFSLGLSWIDKVVIIILTTLVLGVEMLNSAFEELLDMVVEYHHPAVGKIKELMAAAVLLFSIAAFIIGVWIFSRALFFS